MKPKEFLNSVKPISHAKLCGIYFLYDSLHEKGYIGSSIGIGKRVRDHLTSLRANKHGNPILQRTANKYGLSHFSFFLVEEVERTKLAEREDFHMKQFETGTLYNIMPVDRREMPQSVRDKLSITSKGRKWTEEQTRKFKESRKSYVVSEETKKKIADTIRAKNNRKPISLTYNPLTAIPRKLNEEKVREILKLGLSGKTDKEIAKVFNITQVMAWRIRNRDAWRNVQLD